MSELFKTKKTYMILCEGSSEYAYIQILNRILVDNSINISFVAKEVGNGHFSDVEKEYKKQCKKNAKLEKIIWVDKDIYKRNEKNNSRKYSNKKSNIPDFLFTKYNFEDFLVMHLDDDTIENWYQILNTKGHFNIPLKSKVYMPIIKEKITIFNNYKKGEIPFTITLDNIKHAYQIHINPNIKFKSDFLEFIHENVISLI